MDGDPALEALLSRRDALAHEIRDLRRRRRDSEDAIFDAERRRLVREAELPTAGAHLRGFVRDLARALEDAQRELSRAQQDEQEIAVLTARTAARRTALESLLARLSQAAR